MKGYLILSYDRFNVFIFIITYIPVRMLNIEKKESIESVYIMI